MIVCRFEKTAPSEQDAKTSHLHRGLSNNIASLRLEILENRDFSDICTNKGRTDNYFPLKESRLLFGPFDKLMYMQCNTKNKTGFGKPIVVNFFASINERNRAVYDYEQFGNEKDLIGKGEVERYCLQQVTKMAYYV